MHECTVRGAQPPPPTAAMDRGSLRGHRALSKMCSTMRGHVTALLFILFIELYHMTLLYYTKTVYDDGVL